DGNGRWARERDLPRIEGHREGARTVRTVITTCAHLGIEALTLFSFSSENWKRPIDEVAGLMALYLENLAREREELLENNIQFHQIGRREGLPDEVLDAADAMTEATSHCTGLKLVLALNYGSRAELTDAVRDIATAVQSGEMTPGDIDEQVITDHLYTAGLPDPDLLVRTAGERRVSNYLLWQISYAEIYVTDVYWPDFGVANLHDSIRDYARRNRRYGALDHTNT
ncbi:MAG: polyprenyl diphosphate synthase, partial [Planctomycetota bacterium]